MDKLIIEFDKAMRTLFAPASSVRPSPDQHLGEASLSQEQKRHAAALMRVNHCGEVCAQALYQGQALTARTPETRDAMSQAAHEETEHLAWTEKRIQALGGHKSVFNPLWYGGSLALGIAAGLVGDRWSLGFLAETENQVSAHLQSHLASLPEEDLCSRAIVSQMDEDERQHAKAAVNMGAAPLPAPLPTMMRMASRVMTTLSYRA